MNKSLCPRHGPQKDLRFEVYCYRNSTAHPSCPKLFSHEITQIINLQSFATIQTRFCSTSTAVSLCSAFEIFSVSSHNPCQCQSSSAHCYTASYTPRIKISTTLTPALNEPFELTPLKSFNPPIYALYFLRSVPQTIAIGCHSSRAVKAEVSDEYRNQEIANEKTINGFIN